MQRASSLVAQTRPLPTPSAAVQKGLKKHDNIFMPSKQKLIRMNIFFVLPTNWMKFFPTPQRAYYHSLLKSWYMYKELFFNSTLTYLSIYPGLYETLIRNRYERRETPVKAQKEVKSSFNLFYANI